MSDVDFSGEHEAPLREQIRKLGEVSDHVFTFSVPQTVTAVANMLPAAGTVFGTPLVVPYNMNVIRTYIYLPTAPTNSGSVPVGVQINLQRTPVSGASSNLIYTEGATNAATSTTATVSTTTGTTLTVTSAAGFPGPGGIPFGQVAVGGIGVIAGGGSVPGSAGYPGPTPVNYVIMCENELMIVTGGQGTLNWTVTRGAFGTTAATHSSATAYYINRPSVLVSTNSNIWTTGTSPALVPWVWNPPENPGLAMGDLLQPISKVVGSTVAGGTASAAFASPSVPNPIVVEVHCQKA